MEVLERSVDEFFRSAFRGIWKGYCILYLIRGVLDGRYNEEAYDLLKIKHCDIVTGHQGRKNMLTSSSLRATQYRRCSESSQG